LWRRLHGLSPIIKIPKKNGKLKIYIDFRKLNATIEKDTYPLPFTNEILNTVARHETYFFLDGYSRYHQIYIAPEDKYKIAFVTNWGAFIWKVMSFGVLNGSPTYQRIITKAFREYLNNFIKIFLMIL